MDCYYQSKFFFMILKALHLPRNFTKLFATFLYQHELTSINRYLMCYKNPNNLSCVDHFLAKSRKSFFKNRNYFTGLPDFHKLVLSVFKLHFSKAKAKEIS